MLDGISLRETASVWSQTLTYKVLIDFGNEAKGETTMRDKANHGFVLMLLMFADSFRRPMAVFASKGPTNSLVLTQIILKVIVLLENAGVFVDAIVTDTVFANRKKWKELGVNGTLVEGKTFFLHPYDDTRKIYIYIFSDAPHLIKYVHNRLASDVSSEGLKVDSEKNLIVKWNHLQILNGAGCKHPAALCVCSKLSNAHINLTKTNKMRVRHATQNFFGMIRQAASSNDHPSTPTVLHLYRILSIFSILKSPKYGNCYASEETSPFLSLGDLEKIC